MRDVARRTCSVCGTRLPKGDSSECPTCGRPAKRAPTVPAQQAPATPSLHLDDIVADMDDRPLQSLARELGQRTRAYVNTHSFVEGGTLRELDDRYVTVWELRHLAAQLRIASDHDAATEQYLLTLLTAAREGSRPDSTAVPTTHSGIRGGAYADAADRYRTELRSWLAATDSQSGLLELGRLRDVIVRVQAMEGAIDPDSAETLLETCRLLGSAVRNAEQSLEPVRDRLDTLEE